MVDGISGGASQRTAGGLAVLLSLSQYENHLLDDLYDELNAWETLGCKGKLQHMQRSTVMASNLRTNQTNQLKIGLLPIPGVSGVVGMMR
jgi:hypothetical protein